jgi:hypothetical protein
VDEFNYRCEGITPVSVVAAEGRRGQKQQGPESLAAAVDNVPDDFGDQANLGAEIGFHVAFHLLNIVSEEPENVLHCHETGSPYRLFSGRDYR